MPASPRHRHEDLPGGGRRIWKIPLGEEFFVDPRFPGAYADRSRRWVSQVFLDDDHPLQLIGPDPVDPKGEFDRRAVIGEGLRDMVPQSFFFDAKEGLLYLYMGGEPAWFSIEVGVRGFALVASNVHDVVIRGLDLSHNRQPGGQWSLAALSECRRVTIEDCNVRFADFNGLSLYKCTECTVRRCVG